MCEVNMQIYLLTAEGDLRSFSERREHYRHTDQADADLFRQASRPSPLVSLYEKASQTPVHIMREIDQLRYAFRMFWQI